MAKGMSEGAREFRAARDLLLQHRNDQEAARREFTWPRPAHFNWALDHFDHVAATRPDRTALWLVEDDGTEVHHTYRRLSQRSDQVANWLLAQGVHHGDRIMVALGNQVELWEITLAAIKLGAVVSPTSPSLSEGDLVDRLDRGDIAHVVCSPADTERFGPLEGHWTRICVGYMEGWLSYPDSEHAGLEFHPPHPTSPDDPLLLYFTSGTTAVPKLVTHTQSSYPIGHLSTMYWLGVGPGDVHLNVSAPGWAKHAYSSLFAPWNAEATVLVVNQERFDPARLLDAVVRCGVDTLCAPPTVWRMLVQADPGAWRVGLREAVAAGEPLNPEVVTRIQQAWGITVRDGFGQTETTLLVGNGPGQPVVTGSMGRPMPGYDIVLVDPATDEPSDTGEICVDLTDAPVGAMRGYSDDPERTREATRMGLYRTGDIATRDSRGYITYIGRTDDVFKASDYRISPFELESVLLEHEYVVEAAVVPSPDPLRLSVVKAYVSTAEGVPHDAESARSILQYVRGRLSPHKRVRRLEFSDLPKTTSGKIQRVRLRRAEAERGTITDGTRNPREFWEEDLPGLKE
ncbi:AMP-binding protein [Nocardiopsis sp. MG754419]|uniref:AMP-binding protein n=1 Tax=Nocardiopsis sp. MG754419 TaxID=2259865 RepID=UPI001BAB0A47|nr:AMP-binding protein [Nocardiopsis sp. MG754419]MBR8741143.1 AMP-dependent synthetase [Nocardiopsis sp. MG754419]